jgi:hypothetical protein
MREDHKKIFFKVASELQCWIGLREPNPLSVQWMGKSIGGYRCRPKGVECKAKTADNEDHKFAGLVLNPFLCPDGFIRESLEAAQSKYKNDFLLGSSLPPNFYCFESGREKGLIRYYDSFLYADYDLMSIVKSGPRGEFLFTTLPEQKKLFDRIKPLLNRGFGEDLIQHGTEFMYDKGVGARESEFVYWFGPGGNFKVGASSMPKGGH